jgi:hypothetical protein
MARGDYKEHGPIGEMIPRPGKCEKGVDFVYYRQMKMEEIKRQQQSGAGKSTTIGISKQFHEIYKSLAVSLSKPILLP